MLYSVRFFHVLNYFQNGNWEYLRGLKNQPVNEKKDWLKNQPISNAKDASKIGEISEGVIFARENFMQASYKDPMNREQPMYLLTRDGLTLLNFEVSEI